MGTRVLITLRCGPRRGWICYKLYAEDNDTLENIVNRLKGNFSTESIHASNIGIWRHGDVQSVLNLDGSCYRDALRDILCHIQGQSSLAWINNDSRSFVVQVDFTYVQGVTIRFRM